MYYAMNVSNLIVLDKIFQYFGYQFEEKL